MIDLHLRLVLEERNLEVTGLLHECRTMSNFDKGKINRRKKAYVQMTTDLIEEIVSKYNIKTINPKLAAFALLGMLNWTYQWYKASGSIRCDEIIEQFSADLLAGNSGRANMDRIAIFDTTLRDGEQSPGFSMNIEEKLRLARQLERLHVDVIEAGFPDCLRRRFQCRATNCRRDREAHHCRSCPRFAADIDRCWQAIEHATQPAHPHVSRNQRHSSETQTGQVPGAGAGFCRAGRAARAPALQ